MRGGCKRGGDGQGVGCVWIGRVWTGVYTSPAHNQRCHQSWRHASYWNAHLIVTKFSETTSPKQKKQKKNSEIIFFCHCSQFFGNFSFKFTRIHPLSSINVMYSYSLLGIMGGNASSLETSKLIRHLTLYSLKPQQSVKQWRPFSNYNKPNAHKNY